jgi:hypothetical protein
LKESLIKDGCRDAIILWKDTIIDGHNRYEICTQKGIKFNTINKDFEDKNEAKLFIIKNQFARRKISKYDRTILALKYEEIIKEKAKEHLKLSEGKGMQKSANLKVKPLIVREELAKLSNVSHDIIDKVKYIEQKADNVLKDKIRKNEASINKVYKDLKKDERIQRRLNQKIEIPENIKVILKQGDFKNLCKQIPDNSIDLVLTDPPYSKKYLNLYEGVAEESKRILKPSGFLITLAGQMFLPDLLRLMGKHLSYYWLFSYYHKGPVASVHTHNIFCRAKLLLIFQKPPSKKQDVWIEDVIISEGPDKDFHEWGQPVKPFVKLLNTFSKPNDWVLEPFMGGGPVIEACIETKRNVYGFEIDKKYFDMVKNRLKGVKENGKM